MGLLSGRRLTWVLVAGMLVLAGVSRVGLGLAPVARAASSQKISEHVSLKLVRRSGTTRFEHSGRASGTVSGSVRSKITLTHAVVLRGTVTIHTGRGDVRLKVDGRARSIELRSKFSGSATVSGGTGRYRHATGSGTFTGVVNRSTWAATIDATGSLSY